MRPVDREQPNNTPSGGRGRGPTQRRRHYVVRRPPRAETSPPNVTWASATLSKHPLVVEGRPLVPGGASALLGVAVRWLVSRPSTDNIALTRKKKRFVKVQKKRKGQKGTGSDFAYGTSMRGFQPSNNERCSGGGVRPAWRSQAKARLTTHDQRFDAWLGVDGGLTAETIVEQEQGCVRPCSAAVIGVGSFYSNKSI